MIRFLLVPSAVKNLPPSYNHGIILIVGNLDEEQACQ